MCRLSEVSTLVASLANPMCNVDNCGIDMSVRQYLLCFSLFRFLAVLSDFGEAPNVR